MIEIVEWLAGVESLAAEVYRTAAARYKDDPVVGEFLHQLAEEEDEHHQLMTVGAERLRSLKKPVPCAVRVDPQTQAHVERPLRAIKHRLISSEQSARQIIELMVEAEFSEWNDIFLYVVKTAKHEHRDFEQIAATIQEHEQRIARFIDSLPAELRPEKDLSELPTVWEHRMLIVDDDEDALDLLRMVFSRQTEVDVARNGEQALTRTIHHFYNAVIADIDMPVMDGLEFYRKAVESDPRLAGRFLFYTGALTPARKAFLKDNHLPYIIKPVPIGELRENVDTLMLRPQPGV